LTGSVAETMLTLIMDVLLRMEQPTAEHHAAPRSREHASENEFGSKLEGVKMNDYASPRRLSLNLFSS